MVLTPDSDPKEYETRSALADATKSGDVEAVRKVIETRPDLKVKMPAETTWLHFAASDGHIGLVDYWLSVGFDVNCNQPTLPKKYGVFTPLHCAKDAAMTRHLLSRGAHVNVWSADGTALHRAVMQAREASQKGRRRETPESKADQIRVLLEAGADPAIADIKGRTPLGLAIELGHKTAEKALREAGAPEKADRPPKRRTKAAPIDLRKDAKRIATALKKAIERFSRKLPSQPVTGLFLAVSGIDGFVMIAFDVSGADNPWDASHSDFAYVKLEKWRNAYELAESGVKITAVDGVGTQWHTSVPDAAFEKPFFDACVAVLKDAQMAEGFASLTRAPTFAMGVEAASGEHGTGWQVT